LNQLVALDDRISVHQGDVTDLPFNAATFDVVISQHVQMNVADKARLYGEARRVLRSGGHLAIWDIVAGTPGELKFPFPWADRPELSYLVSADLLRDTIESAGFTVTRWSDMTEDAVAVMEIFLSTPPGPLGLHNFVDNFVLKANNLVNGLLVGRLRAVQAVFEARS
jgi:SAM-dependent methyltransferase